MNTFFKIINIIKKLKPYMVAISNIWTKLQPFISKLEQKNKEIAQKKDNQTIDDVVNNGELSDLIDIDKKL